MMFNLQCAVLSFPNIFIVAETRAFTLTGKDKRDDSRESFLRVKVR